MNDKAINQAECKLDDSPIGIFISHRLEDKDIATKIKAKLETDFKKNLVKVHVCEDTQGEKSWRDWIERKVNESRILIFLYTVEHQEAWRWCMYEVGLFNGLKIVECNRKVICLKNPGIERLPAPIENMTPYIADEEGIKDFLKNLLFEETFTEKILIKPEEKSAKIDKALEEAVNEINLTFLRSRLYLEYYDYRITIDLNSKDNGENYLPIDGARIYGDGKTMDILNISRKEILWPNFYRVFKERGQSAWLDEIKQFVEVSDKSEPNDRILHPFIIEKFNTKNWYLPVVSSIERMRPIDPVGRHEPNNINVIFIPQLLSQEGLLETLPTLIPFSKVKFYLDFDAETGEKTLAVDENGETIMPHVVEMNDLCLDLYYLRRSEFENENLIWTADKLVNRLKAYDLVKEDNINKLLEDQGRVIDELLLRGFPQSEAWIPFQFTDKHRKFRKECYLPVIVSSQTVDDTSGRHVAYLLVGYVKDFWPPNHDQNPFNERAITDNS